MIETSCTGASLILIPSFLSSTDRLSFFSHLRYGVDPEAIRNGPPPSEEDVRVGNHSSEARYKWTCPSCENICQVSLHSFESQSSRETTELTFLSFSQCSICRKKNGLEPVGNLSIKTKNGGKRTAADLLKNGPGKVRSFPSSRRVSIPN